MRKIRIVWCKNYNGKGKGVMEAWRSVIYPRLGGAKEGFLKEMKPKLRPKCYMSWMDGGWRSESACQAEEHVWRRSSKRSTVPRGTCKESGVAEGWNTQLRGEWRGCRPMNVGNEETWSDWAKWKWENKGPVYHALAYTFYYESNGKS